MSIKDHLKGLFKDHINEHRKSIDLMEKGTFETHEVRDGQNVDTTDESIERAKKMVAELEKALSRLEAGM